MCLLLRKFLPYLRMINCKPYLETHKLLKKQHIGEVVRSKSGKIITVT